MIEQHNGIGSNNNSIMHQMSNSIGLFAGEEFGHIVSRHAWGIGFIYIGYQYFKGHFGHLEELFAAWRL
jgi:hypothetical protein